MTKDEIIKMAREAGWEYAEANVHEERLERFSAIVAAAEREACADIVGLCCGSCAAAIRARGEK